MYVQPIFTVDSSGLRLLRPISVKNSPTPKPVALTPDTASPLLLSFLLCQSSLLPSCSHLYCPYLHSPPISINTPVPRVSPKLERSGRRRLCTSSRSRKKSARFS